MIPFQLLLSEPREGVLVVNVSGEVDLSTARQLEDALTQAVAARKHHTLVVDLTHLGFMDSTGLHLLARTHSAMKAAGGQLTVVSPSPVVRKLLEIVNLDRFITVVDSRDDALAVAA
jgi:anti-anti-sigma factor